MQQAYQADRVEVTLAKHRWTAATATAAPQAQRDIPLCHEADRLPLGTPYEAAAPGDRC